MLKDTEGLVSMKPVLEMVFVVKKLFRQKFNGAFASFSERMTRFSCRAPGEQQDE